jgi:hypothetical protein
LFSLPGLYFMVPLMLGNRATPERRPHAAPSSLVPASPVA